MRPCITEHRVLPCPSVVQSYSVSSFVPWCYNDVTGIELRERVCRTATGDAVRAPVFVRKWVFGVVGPRAIVIIFGSHAHRISVARPLWPTKFSSLR